MIPALPLHPDPDERSIPNRVESVSGVGSQALSFHLYHDNYFVGSMSWNRNEHYWNFHCDSLETADMYIVIGLLQDHIHKHAPTLYQEAELPNDPEEAVLAWEKFVPFRD